jgi:hypothetical protein
MGVERFVRQGWNADQVGAADDGLALRQRADGVREPPPLRQETKREDVTRRRAEDERTAGIELAIKGPRIRGPTMIRRYLLSLTFLMTVGCSNTIASPQDNSIVGDAGSPFGGGQGELGEGDASGRAARSVAQGDAGSQITVRSLADVASKRQELISYIWGSRGFPSAAMPNVVRNVQSPVENLANLARVDELDFVMPAKLTTGAAIDITTTGYHFIPRAWKKGRAVILHQGHTCTDDDDESTDDAPSGMWRALNELLSEGYPVVALFMPYMDSKTCGAQTHGWMLNNIDSRTSSPFQYFLEPTARTLNYLQERYPQYVDFAMVGLSGGGWTTTVYSAIDPRITVGIDVAGSLPLYVRSGWSVGDEEQYWSSFYSIAGYPDLYVMGSVGPKWNRRQVVSLNRHDTCCFGEAQYSTDGLPRLQGRTWNQAIREYESNVQGVLNNIGGSFHVKIDEFANVHEISWGTLTNTIMTELDGDRRDVSAVSATSALVRGTGAGLWYYSRQQGWVDEQTSVAGIPAGIPSASGGIDLFYRDPSTDRLASAGSLLSDSPVGIDPVVASWGPGRIDLVDVDSNYGLTHWRSKGDGFEMEKIGGRVLGRPALLASSGHLDVFARNFSGGVDHYWSNGSSPWQSESVGGSIVGFPAAVRVGGSMRVYARGADGAIHRAAKDGEDWGWTTLFAPDSFLGSPAAVVVDSEEQIQARTTKGELGSFANGTYSNLGGSFADSPTIADGVTWVMDQTGAVWYFDGSEWVAVEAEPD